MMRDYAKIAPQFWIGDTGKRLRGDAAAQVVAAYLLSCPHANMIGLFYLPLTFLSHETGIPLQGASEALRRVEGAGFCAYDEDAEVVWVFEMAKFQIGESLKPADNRCQGVEREYESVPNNKHLGAFFDRYAIAFHLKNRRGEPVENPAPAQAPSEPLRSQEQEQEQEQEKTKPHRAIANSTRGFAEFWSAWPASPRKVAKAKCQRLWDGRRLESISGDIVRHVSAMRGTKQWRDGFEPAPLTYLNQRRWEDGLPDGGDAESDKFRGVL